MSSRTERLAAFAAGLTYVRLPGEAVAAARGEIAPDAIVVDYRRTDPEVGRLYGRVEIVADAGVTAADPGAALVELRLRDGRVLRRAVPHRPGSPLALTLLGLACNLAATLIWATLINPINRRTLS